jgi:hypothetical protein
MKITKSELREIIREELTLSKNVNESIDLEKFEKAIRDADKINNTIHLQNFEIVDLLIAALILKMGFNEAKKYAKELTDIYKSLYH